MPVRVATVIARLEGGAGGLAVAGIRATPGVEHTIVTGSGGRLVEAAREAGAEVRLERSLRPDIEPLADRVALGRLTALLRSGGYGVVHTHGAKAGAVGRLAAVRAGVPRVAHTYHGFPFHAFQSPARRAAYVGVERSLGRYTDVVLCVGAAVAAEAVRRRLARPGGVRTIGVCVDGPAVEAAALSARCPEARRAARARLGIPDAAAVVGAVGRCTYQKAPEDLFAAVARLARPGVVAVWVGGGELEARCRALAARLGPDVRAVVTGERQDVLALLPAFDVFALPSRYEGLPTAVVEAMVCGVPVVATAVNAVDELVVPGETGLLVPAGRPDVLADAVGALLDDPARAAALVATAHARLGRRFTATRLRAALLDAWGVAGGASRAHGAVA